MEYDEFGNRVGETSDLDSDSDVIYEQTTSIARAGEEPGINAGGETAVSRAVIDPAEDLYGPHVDIVHQEDDTQPLEVPIVSRGSTEAFTFENNDVPDDSRYLVELMKFPDQIRNVAICGSLHHGKTSLADCLVRASASFPSTRLGTREDERLRHIDSHIMVRNRGISVKSCFLAMLLTSGIGKSFVFNVVDTPGHPDFYDELAVGLRLADGIILVVDVVEGLLPTAKLVLEQAAAQNMPVVLFLNKLDRLVLDLMLPPEDAYIRTSYVVEQINNFCSSLGSPVFDPRVGNVVFGSTEYHWSFTLHSYASMYAEQFDLDEDMFAQRLWGDVFYHEGVFTHHSGKRTFTTFILEPIYKLFTSVLSESRTSLTKTLHLLNISLDKKSLKLNPKALLAEVFSLYFTDFSGFVDTLVQSIKSPLCSDPSGICNSRLGDPEGPCVGNIVKLCPTNDGASLMGLIRVFQGSLRRGELVSVKTVVSADSQDHPTPAKMTIEELWIPQADTLIPVEGVPFGNWAFVSGVESHIVKSGTLSAEMDSYFAPINYLSNAVIKLGVEPLKPSSLPQMIEGLQRLYQTHGSLEISLEESGEHIIQGAGELGLDCALYELREIFAGVEIKCSDPAARFCETSGDQSYAALPTFTPNGENRVTMLASPLSEAMVADVTKYAVGSTALKKALKQDYGWDALAAASVWAFGPSSDGPNMLIDDSLSSEKASLLDVKDYVVEGFRWSTRAGPLCEEPMRNVLFKLMEFSISDSKKLRTGGQIIPTVQRACYSAFLVSSPTLLEPQYACFAVGPIKSGRAVYGVLKRRRGTLVRDVPIAGTDLFLIEGKVPVMDSFGLETDAKLAADGQLQIELIFCGWDKVPGDPLDSTVNLKPLEVATGEQLARDYVLKTRKRKGLSFEPSLVRYLDREVAEALGTDVPT